MNHYEKPAVEVLSFRADESIMDDQQIGGGLSGTQGGGAFPGAQTLHDSRDNR